MVDPTVYEDIQKAKEYLSEVNRQLGELVNEPAKTARREVATEISDTIGSVYARLARASFNLARKP